MEDIAHVVAAWTGVPVEQLTADDAQRLLSLEKIIHHDRIVGQVRLSTTSLQPVHAAPGVSSCSDTHPSDTNCTTPSLIPTVNGNTVQLPLRTDNCPQPKEAQPLAHALTSD